MPHLQRFPVELCLRERFALVAQLEREERRILVQKAQEDLVALPRGQRQKILLFDPRKLALVAVLERAGEAVGGGMCQFSNLIHWMVLHAPLTITEQHHHDQFDLFPDFGRQVPFGTGTSIFYNYLDYRFRNDTEQTYQLLVHTTPTHLCGELRTDAPLAVKYHIAAENERFVREDGVVYRCGEVYRAAVDKSSGNTLARELLRCNHARVLYDTAGLEIRETRAT